MAPKEGSFDFSNEVSPYENKYERPQEQVFDLSRPSLFTGRTESDAQDSAQAFGEFIKQIERANLYNEIRPEMRALYQNERAAHNLANTPDRESPYDRKLADAMRQNQMTVAQAIANQERQNISGAQGARAMGQSTQQAMMQGNRAGQLGAGYASQNMARDVAQARLAEIMKARAGGAETFGAVRTGDLKSFSDSANAAQQNQKTTSDLRKFYMSQGYDLARAQQMADIELKKIFKDRELRSEKENAQTQKAIYEAFATIVGMFT